MLLLPSNASVEAGLRPALLLMGNGASVGVLVPCFARHLMLLKLSRAPLLILCYYCFSWLPCHLMPLFSFRDSLVISCFSCHIGSWAATIFVFNLRPTVFGMDKEGGLLCCHFTLRLSSHAALVISCSSCPFVLPLLSPASLVISCFPSRFGLLSSPQSSLVSLGAGLWPTLLLFGKMVSVLVIISLFACPLMLLS